MNKRLFIRGLRFGFVRLFSDGRDVFPRVFARPRGCPAWVGAQGFEPSRTRYLRAPNTLRPTMQGQECLIAKPLLPRSAKRLIKAPLDFDTFTRTSGALCSSKLMILDATCHISYSSNTPIPAIMMLRPRSGYAQWITREEYVFEPHAPVVEYTDKFGNLCQRVLIPKGKFDVLLQLPGAHGRYDRCGTWRGVCASA